MGIQKKFLTNLSRDRAKEVFQLLKSNTTPISNVKKAQHKITEIAITLIQKKTISFE